MTEPWIKRAAGDGPRTHALVIGVSAYEHLAGVPAALELPEDQTLGLGQLRSAAASAWAFAQWLANDYNPLLAPLGTIRLLLSPSPDEKAQVPGLNAPGANVLPATKQNAADAVWAWKEEFKERPNDVAILYAAGHGSMLSKDEGAYVLLQDFAAPNRPRLENSLNVPRIRRGLAGPNIAKRQFFFVDACSVRHTVAREMQDMTGGVGLDEPAEHPPEVSAIYASAAPGTLALGTPGKGTLFSQGLLECLDGLAGTLDNDGRWVITDTSLVGPIRDRVTELAAEHDAEQVATSGGTLGPAVFHVLPEPPPLEVQFSVEPSDAAPFCFATLDDDAGATVLERSPLHPSPLQTTVPAGLYTVAVAIDPTGAGSPWKATQRPCYLRPPKPKPVVVSVS